MYIKFYCILYILECRNLFKLPISKYGMNKWLEILFGLILVAGSIYVAWGINNPFWQGFGSAAIQFLQGGIVWFVILIGLLFLMLGISDLRD